MSDPRFCSNCRAELAGNATAGEACGVFAVDVFDGRKPRPPRKPSGLLFGLLVILILGGAGYWFFEARKTSVRTAEPPLPSTRVVADRPGGARRAKGARLTE